jgi:hypothetical protein
MSLDTLHLVVLAIGIAVFPQQGRPFLVTLADTTADVQAIDDKVPNNRAIIIIIFFIPLFHKISPKLQK